MRRYPGLAAALWAQEGLAGDPFVMVVERHDGTPIAAIPVVDGDWDEAVKWGYLALMADNARVTQLELPIG